MTIAPDPPVTTTRHFEYDPAGRLWRVCDDDTCADVLSEYLYDQNGNRTGGTIGGETISATYDDQDRLLSYTRGSTTHTYTYGDNGELESKTNAATSETTSYSYDAFGNLRSVTLPDETEIEYLIDGRNRRVGKQINGITQRRFAYRGRLNPVAEFAGDGELVAKFVYASKPNVPDYVIKYASGVEIGRYRIVSDHLGSVRLVVDLSDASVAQEISYDEFGVMLSNTHPDFQPFGFAGGMHDSDTGLVQFGKRDYDPNVGKWTAKDPSGFAGGDSNLFAYVISDPLNLIDPHGLQFAPPPCNSGFDGSIDWSAIHRDRNRFNHCPSEEPKDGEKDCKGRTWRKDVRGKYRAADGSECAYENGVLLPDDGSNYTFNYGGGTNPFHPGHIVDVVPGIVGSAHTPGLTETYSCGSGR